MMNASVYIELSCEFGTSLFTLHCPQFRSTLKFYICDVLGQNSKYVAFYRYKPNILTAKGLEPLAILFETKAVSFSIGQVYVIERFPFFSLKKLQLRV